MAHDREATPGAAWCFLALLVTVGCTGQFEAVESHWASDGGDGGIGDLDGLAQEGEPWIPSDAGSDGAEDFLVPDEGDTEHHGGVSDGGLETDGDAALSHEPEGVAPRDEAVLVCGDVGGECLGRGECLADGYEHEEAVCMGSKACCIFG